MLILNKGRTKILREGRRLAGVLRRIPPKVWVSSASLVLAITVIAVCLSIINGRYALSDAQLNLLGDPGIDAADLKETAEAYTYNMAEDLKDDRTRQVVAGASESDSTPEVPYQASLSKDPSKGLTFGDAGGQLSFSLVPNQPSMEGRAKGGRVIYPSSTGKKSVYTFKVNGVKEDILLDRAPSKVVEYSWNLDLGDKLEAKQLPDGSIGIFAADPLLYGDLQVGDEKSQKLVDEARKNGEKTQMVFNLPAPFIVDAKGLKNIEDVSYKLEGNLLTLEARNMVNKHYPLSIDPTVVVDTTAEFRVGYDDGMINYTTTIDGEIQRVAVTAGDVGAFTIETDFLPDPRAYHATVAYRGFLYVVGGFTSNLDMCDDDPANTTQCNDVLYATINSDGSISAPTCTGGTLTGVWCSDGDYFDIPRHEHSAVVYNNFLYVIGGTNGVGNDQCDGGYSATTPKCNDVQYAPINSDGSIGSFQTDSDRFSVPRSTHASVVYNGYLYVIAGEGADTDTCEANGASSLICDDVQYASIKADGSIGAFQSNSARLNSPRYGIAAAAYNGYLYVTGGMGVSDGVCDSDGAVVTSLCDEVLYAKINDDGSTSSFTRNSEIFEDPRYNHTTVAHGGFLYVIGGNGGAADVCETDGGVSSFQCNDVQYAEINADGSTRQFSLDSDHFDEPRDSHTSVVYNGRIYVVAGAGDDTNNDDCDVGTGDYTHCSDVQYALIATGTPSFTSVLGAFSEPDPTNDPEQHFDFPRSAHATVAYNGYLYVIGGSINAASSTNCKDTGVSSTNCNDVQYAPISYDGSVGDWTTDSDSYFSVPRNAHIGFAYNGYIYIVGGSNSTNDACQNDENGDITTTSCNDIQYAPVNADGSLGTWTVDAGDRFDTPRTDHASFAYNGYVYVVGGIGGAGNGACDDDADVTAKCNDVQYAPINADGSIGSFTTDSGDRFDYARTAHTAVAYNGYIYVSGGENVTSTSLECHTSDPVSLDVCNDTQFAAINGDGSIGSFSATASFFTPRMRHGAVAQNGYFYIMGGFQDTNDTACKDGLAASRYCHDVQAAEINSDGTLGIFLTQTYFGDPRHIKATTYNGYLYIVGGFSYATGTHCKDSSQSSMSYCNDYQVAPILTPAENAAYERFFDVGDSGTNVRINSVEFNGQAVCGARVTYRTAGADGIFGSTVSHDAVAPGAELSIDELNKRYILVRYILTDASCGTQSNIEDITLNWQYDPPDPPTLNTLADGAISQPLTSIAFQFRSPQANGSYLRYMIRICADSGCSSVVQTACQANSSTPSCTASQTGWSGQDAETSTAYVGNSVITSSTMATFTFTGTLAIDNDYYWQAYAIDPAKSNTWSAVSAQRVFYTNYRPAAPILNSPANNASGVSVTPEFRFTATDQDGDYIRYRIKICQDSGCSSQISGSPFDQTVSQTGWSGQGTQGATAYISGQEAIFTLPIQLGVSTQYWWEVEAKDPGGTDQWSAISLRNTFTTSTTAGAGTVIRGGTTIRGGTGF